MSFAHRGVLSCAALAAAVLAGCSSGGGKSDRAPRPANALTVSVHGSAFAGVPSHIRPGMVTLRFDNSGPGTHMAAIGELAGHRVPDLLASLRAHHRLPAWFRLVGGVDELAAGHRGSWTGRLPGGSYVLISLSAPAGGPPDAMRGMVAPFAVAGAPVRTGLPRPTATIALGGGGSLRLARLPRGTTNIEVVNDDTVTRTVDVTRIRPGQTYAAVLAQARTATGVPAALLQLGGTGVPPHGRVVIGIEAAPVGAEYVVFDIDHVQDGAIAHVVTS